MLIMGGLHHSYGLTEGSGSQILSDMLPLVFDTFKNVEGGQLLADGLTFLGVHSRWGLVVGSQSAFELLWFIRWL